jgi:hypothetical protein
MPFSLRFEHENSNAAANLAIHIHILTCRVGATRSRFLKITSKTMSGRVWIREARTESTARRGLTKLLWSGVERTFFPWAEFRWKWYPTTRGGVIWARARSERRGLDSPSLTQTRTISSPWRCSAIRRTTATFSTPSRGKASAFTSPTRNREKAAPKLGCSNPQRAPFSLDAPPSFRCSWRTTQIREKLPT